METIGDYFCVKFHRQMIKGKEECFIAFPIIPYAEMLSDSIEADPSSY